MVFYFAPILDDINCYELEAIKDMAKSDGLEEIEVIKAKRETGEGYFFCKHFGEVGEVGQSDCGTLCREYVPRNSINGRCIHSGYCYSYTDEKQIIKL